MLDSCGERLLHNLGVVQASFFPVSIIPTEKRLEWLKSLPKAKYRNQSSKLKDGSLLLVISQNCDIATSKDSVESSIELLVCKKIQKDKVFPGNQFVNSVRKLHFNAEGDWFEANVDYILTIDKCDLLSALSSEKVAPPISLLDKNTQKIIPAWRSNRYLRTALPNNFNKELNKILEPCIKKLEETSKSSNPDVGSFIRAIYIRLDNYDEVDSYNFEFFTLMRHDTEDMVLSEVQDLVENLAYDLVNESGYSDVTNDKGGIYADRDSNTYVSYLAEFKKLNFDSLSLSAEDSDTGPEAV